MGINIQICCKQQVSIKNQTNTTLSKLEIENPIHPQSSNNVLLTTNNKLTLSYVTDKTSTSTCSVLEQSKCEKKEPKRSSHSIVKELQIKPNGKHIAHRNSAFLNRTLIVLYIFGDHKTGKTSFLNRFCSNTFSDEYSPSTNEEKKDKKCPFNCRFYDISLTIPNISDNESSLEKIDYYLIFYDVNNIESFEKAKIIVSHLITKYQIHSDRFSNIVFVGNKNDLERKVTNEMIEEVSKKYKIVHFEISIKNNKGITKMIQKLIESFDHDVFIFDCKNK